jgi:putative heme-binding domain-containing protein
MVCGTGEAPSAIVPYRGALWVTSWGDHTIERYWLTSQGASFDAKKEVVVQGGTDFRPVGMAIAPDGSIYFSDWVKRNYDLHRHGRLWRLKPATEATSQPEWPQPQDHDLFAGEATIQLTQHQALLADPFIATRWAHRRSRDRGAALAVENVLTNNRAALHELQALRLAEHPLTPQLARQALRHDESDVRLYAVRWIADEHLTEFLDDIVQLLEAEISDKRYFLAVLAAIDWLGRPPRMTGSDIADGLLARELRLDDRSPQRKAMALGLISPDHEFLTSEVMQNYLLSSHSALRTEAVRTLALQTNPARFDLLAAVAADQDTNESLRADAVAGLAASAEKHRDLLEKFAASRAPAVRREAVRALRAVDSSRSVKEETPPASDLDSWLELMATPGDAEAGRRIFFSDQGAKCGVCHAHGGRGGTVGPELTTLGEHRSRRQLMQSILQPNEEIAPHYVPWIIESTEGQTYVGLRAPQGGDSGWETYIDGNGKPTILASEQIASRTPSDTSIMPGGLEQLISVADFRDLVTFLQPPEAERRDR